MVRAGNIAKLLVNGLASFNHRSGKAGLSRHMPSQMATQSSVHTAEHMQSMGSLICLQNKRENIPTGETLYILGRLTPVAVRAP